MYFQEPGRVEAEVAVDWAVTLRKIYFSLSGDAPANDFLKHKPRSAGLLDDLVDPQPFPDWLSASDLAGIHRSLCSWRFHWSMNRYRAQPLDAQEVGSFANRQLLQPTCFIGGEQDAVRYFFPGMDGYSDPLAELADPRGCTLIPDVGHWVQQEAPEATNEALRVFLATLD